MVYGSFCNPFLENGLRIVEIVGSRKKGIVNDKRYGWLVGWLVRVFYSLSSLVGF